MESKTTTESSDRRFALLIDADNVSARYLKPILNELSKYGTVTIKRIYGDWTLTLHAKWKDALLENSITPIQQFGYTQGKNATDSAMIIDAMDILYTDNVDGFCLVSSDSDFTRLASRLRESGAWSSGMGEKKTPTPFRRACDVFATTLELLVQNKRNEKAAAATRQPKDSVEQAVVWTSSPTTRTTARPPAWARSAAACRKRLPRFRRAQSMARTFRSCSRSSRGCITKDHSSVTVDFAEARSALRRRRSPSAQGRRGKPAKATGAEEAAGVASELDEAAQIEGVLWPRPRREMEKPEKKPRSRIAARAAIAARAGLRRCRALVGGPPGCRGAARGAEQSDVARRSGGGGAGVRGRRSGRGGSAGDRTVAPRPGDAWSAAAPAPSARPARRRKPMPPKRRRRARRRSRRRPRSPRRRKSRRRRQAAKSKAEENPAAKKVAAKRKETAKKTAEKKNTAKKEALKKALPRCAAQEEARGRHLAGYIRELVADAGAEGIMLSNITDALRCQVQGLRCADPRLFPDAPVYGLGWDYELRRAACLSQ